MQFLVVGDPTPAMRDGKQQIDRETGRPQWNIPITMIGDDIRAESDDLGVPEGGFPKDLGITAFITPESLTGFTWANDKGGHGMFLRARSVKVVGGQAGVKGVAA